MAIYNSNITKGSTGSINPLAEAVKNATTAGKPSATSRKPKTVL